MKYNSKRILQIIIISVVVLLILIAVLIIQIKKNSIRNSTSGDNSNILNETQNEYGNEINSSNEGETIEAGHTIYPNLSTPKDVCDYLGCTYIDTKKSTEKNYSKDIYMNFEFDATSFLGMQIVSNKNYYEDVIINIADKMDSNFRIIDESRSMIINVNISIDSNTNQKSATYLINNNPKYFDDEISKIALDDIIKTRDNYSNLTTNNEMLKSLINNNWEAKISVQNIKSQSDNYYFYNGYKVRMIENKVYNIIFDEDYNNEIFTGIKTREQQTDIYNKIPNPFYYGSDSSSALGYKTKEFYVFFYNGKISIYRNGELDKDKNEQLNFLMTKLNQDGDYVSFINNITTIYTDYTEFTKNNNQIDIKYPLEGFEIKFGYEEKNGITIYDNFHGKIVNDKTLDDIMKDGNIPANVYIVNDTLMNQELDKTMK